LRGKPQSRLGFATRIRNAAGHDKAVTKGLGAPTSLPIVDLRHLQVLHWRGDHVANASPCAGPTAVADAFQIDTCQRRVALLLDASVLERLRSHLPADGAVQIFSGAAAYSFLLRFACGLESRLVAETEIFGQIKEAWRAYELAEGSLRRPLAPLMRQLFRDTKEIRAQYLSGTGSASYGSQVRRLLRDGASGPALLIGAGQLAQSVAPWIECSELWIWNRTPGKAEALAQQLRERHPERQFRVLQGREEAELTGWRQAVNVVVCVPADAERDAARVQAWLSRTLESGQVIHLGGDMHANPLWREVKPLTSLDTLFNMLQAQSDHRQRQVQCALQACTDRAVPHGDEGSAQQANGREDVAALAALSG
jgi:Glutamyl-tRNAGlu reductase, N-terminal domain